MMAGGISIIGLICIAVIVLAVGAGIVALVMVAMRGSSRVDPNLRPCPGCGRMNNPSDQFCPQCGTQA